MRSFQNRPTLRWLVPVAAAATFLAGGLVATTASADPALPERTAEQLIADVAAAKPSQLSGTIETTAELGLPELPGGRHGSDFQALLTGKNTIRVWSGNEDQSRVAVHGTFGESDLVRNGDQVWLWNSQEKTALQHTLSGDEGKKGDPGQDAPTPQQLAAKAIAAIEPTTEVSVARNVTVAGRAAYELVLEPKDAKSLVEQVRIAVDGEKSLPLRVQVFGEGADQPAAEAAFTAIDFTTPDASVFDFTPPPGTEVKKSDDADGHDKGDREHGTKPEGKKQEGKKGDKSDAASSTVVGKGWTTVFVGNAGELAGAEIDETTLETLNALPKVSGEWGTGRLFSSRLVSAVITDDGRIAAGAVRPEVLYTALER